MNDLSKYTESLNKYIVTKFIYEHDCHNQFSMQDFAYYGNFDFLLELMFEGGWWINEVCKNEYQTIWTTQGKLGERLNGGKFSLNFSMYFADCIENKFEQEYGQTFSPFYKANLIDTFLSNQKICFFKILADHGLASLVDFPEFEPEEA